MLHVSSVVAFDHPLIIIDICKGGDKRLKAPSVADPPGNCHLNVKKCPKIAFFSKKLPKMTIFLIKKKFLAIF